MTVLNSDDLCTSQNSSLPKLGYINLLHFLDLSQFFAMRVAHIYTCTCCLGKTSGITREQDGCALTVKEERRGGSGREDVR